MDIFTHFVLLLHLGTVLQKAASLSIPWKNHVYTGRHFDDYVTATQVGPPEVIRPALLILYSPACENNIGFLKDQIMPPEKYFVLAKHDYDIFPRNIWYKLDERDNLSQRYKPSTCPEYLFFRQGSSTLLPERHNQKKDTDILSWIWERLRVYFVVSNTRNEAISVHFDPIAEHETQSVISVNPGKIISMDAHISDIVYITVGVHTVYGNVVDSKFPRYLAITEKSVFDNDLVSWLSSTKRSIKRESRRIEEWRRHIAYFYLLNFKQPVLLPRFTKSGYRKGDIPQELYKEILNFYNKNIPLRQKEKNEVEPAINDKEVKCTMVFLSTEMIETIGRSMLPLMESWCNCSLEQTRLYGIREYHHGNILRNHVDRVNTHIISIILQVHKELGGEPDWPLEVIDMNGQVQHIYLKPGEMLFYESATLIHGRPSPFKGNLFANAFLHYRPLNNWGWDFENGHVVHNSEAIDKMSYFTNVDVEKGKSFHYLNVPVSREEL